MKKLEKIVLWMLAVAMVVVFILGFGFVYKIRYGFPVSFETEIPTIDFPNSKKALLLFSKSTGFRHGESIAAGKETLRSLASTKGWFLHDTEAGGVFNDAQLRQFDVVIFNNCTGRVLSDEQREALENYVENGGKLIGIHGAGDDSHHWEWYEDHLIGAPFSHHPIDPQLQEAEVLLDMATDSVLTSGLPSAWKHTDEWYIFLENPRNNGFNIVYTINGDQIDPNGNILWMKNRNFGMGTDHPVAWHRKVGSGWTFYTSMGHHAQVWEQRPFVRMLTNFIEF